MERKKKKKKHNLQYLMGCGCLVVGVALVVANLPAAAENRVDLLEGIVLIILGGYLLGSLVWSS